MKNEEASPLFIPLAAILRERGIRACFAIHLDSIHDSLRPGHPRMKELNCMAPLLAVHPLHDERRMVIALDHSLDAWRERMLRRGINLISASADGLLSNPHGLADEVCRHIYRISPEELLQMVQNNMPMRAISAFTGIEAPELSRIIARYYGKTLSELRAEVL